jgi:hypothetical protein
MYDADVSARMMLRGVETLKAEKKKREVRAVVVVIVVTP